MRKINPYPASGSTARSTTFPTSSTSTPTVMVWHFSLHSTSSSQQDKPISSPVSTAPAPMPMIHCLPLQERVRNNQTNTESSAAPSRAAPQMAMIRLFPCDLAFCVFVALCSGAVGCCFEETAGCVPNTASPMIRITSAAISCAISVSAISRAVASFRCSCPLAGSPSPCSKISTAPESSAFLIRRRSFACASPPARSDSNAYTRR